jgi:hypothetical protein
MFGHVPVNLRPSTAVYTGGNGCQVYIFLIANMLGIGNSPTGSGIYWYVPLLRSWWPPGESGRRVALVAFPCNFRAPNTSWNTFWAQVLCLWMDLSFKISSCGHVVLILDTDINSPDCVTFPHYVNSLSIHFHPDHSAPHCTWLFQPKDSRMLLFG